MPVPSTPRIAVPAMASNRQVGAANPATGSTTTTEMTEAAMSWPADSTSGLSCRPARNLARYTKLMP